MKKYTELNLLTASNKVHICWLYIRIVYSTICRLLNDVSSAFFINRIDRIYRNSVFELICKSNDISNFYKAYHYTLICINFVEGDYMDSCQYTSLTSEEIKKRELAILLSFQKFCKKNNLLFYLSGGTLLGAIRHHGFIPWDDDIDVCMPRADYERLIQIYINKDHQYCLRAPKLGNFTAPFAKLVDTETWIEAQYTVDKDNYHLWIDIFPVDGLPSSLDEVKKVYKKCNFYRRMLLIMGAKLGEGKTTFHKYIKYILKPLAILFYGKQRCVDKIEKIAQTYHYQDYEYVGAITWGLYGVGERMLKCEFEKQVSVQFEGYQFPAFSCWKSYLTGLYGDYMKLPPVEKRQTHDMKVYVFQKNV